VNSRPYKSAKREEAAKRTRARIIAAAAEILGSRKNSHDFSLEGAAKAAGVTRLTVYNQFGSRRALLEAVFDDRAARGGLQRIADAMRAGDPQEGLRDLIAVFCDFWSFDAGAIGWLHAAGAGDAEFEASVRERNERRRKVLSVLVRRMANRKNAATRQVRDLVDTLFALTGFHFFSSLRTQSRSKDATCKMIQTMAADAVRRFMAQNSGRGRSS
jgi:AcrR family transcriptional regulator